MINEILRILPKEDIINREKILNQLEGFWMDMIKFECSLWKIQVDREGECKIILLVSSNYKDQVIQIIQIPTEKRLAVGITEFEIG